MDKSDPRYQQALKLGFTDAQIQSYLKSGVDAEIPASTPSQAESHPNYQKALDSGFTKDQIDEYLRTGKDVELPKNEPVEITQSFGEKSPYEPQSGGINYGVDFGYQSGTPIALPDGEWEVLDSYDQADPNGGSLSNWDNEGYGNSVLVRNRKTGETMRFSHLSSVNVQPGEILSKGYVLGRTGASGHVTGPHLDLEYRNGDGQLQDVMKSPYSSMFSVKKTIQPTTAPQQAPQQTANIPKPTATQPVQPTVQPQATQQPTEQPQPTQQLSTKLSDSVIRTPEPITQPANSVIDIKPTTSSTKDPLGIDNYIPDENTRKSALDTMSKVKAALAKEGIDDPNTLAYAMATIQHETAGTYKPIEEYGGREQAKKLGYSGGENYYGRGYIQLTHDYNYKQMGDRIGQPELVNKPEEALNPDTAAKITAAFFKDRGVANKASQGDFYGARAPINGTDQADKIASYAQAWKPIVDSYDQEATKSAAMQPDKQSDNILSEYLQNPLSRLTPSSTQSAQMNKPLLPYYNTLLKNN